MITILSALQLISAFLIIALVLLQPAKQGASAFASTQSGPMGNSVGTSPLFKITMILAFFIMISSVIISRQRILEAKTSETDKMQITELKKDGNEKVVDLTQEPAKAAAEAAPNAAAPTAPSAAAPEAAPKAATPAPEKK